MECPNYDEHRLKLEEEITNTCSFEFKTLMYGHEDLSNGYDAVHRYLEITKRFS